MTTVELNALMETTSLNYRQFLAILGSLGIRRSDGGHYWGTPPPTWEEGKALPFLVDGETVHFSTCTRWSVGNGASLVPAIEFRFYPED
jgi:hypothetical protein